jgi:hypothetical protein
MEQSSARRRLYYRAFAHRSMDAATMTTMSRAAIFLLQAVEHARYACERTRRMLAVAIARFWALLAIERAAA